MKKKARTRLKSNFVIQALERPIFNKPHVLSRSRQIDTSGDVWEIGESHPVSLNWSAFSELPTLSDEGVHVLDIRVGTLSLPSKYMPKKA